MEEDEILDKLYKEKNEIFAAADDFELQEEMVEESPPPKGANFRITRIKRKKEEKARVKAMPPKSISTRSVVLESRKTSRARVSDSLLSKPSLTKSSNRELEEFDDRVASFFNTNKPVGSSR